MLFKTIGAPKVDVPMINMTKSMGIQCMRMVWFWYYLDRIWYGVYHMCIYIYIQNSYTPILHFLRAAFFPGIFQSPVFEAKRTICGLWSFAKILPWPSARYIATGLHHLFTVACRGLQCFTDVVKQLNPNMVASRWQRQYVCSFKDF